jgi:elongator complex protein 1
METLDLGFVPSFAAMSPGGDFMLVADGSVLRVFDLDGRTSIELCSDFAGEIVDAAFRRDNKFIAVASEQKVTVFRNTGQKEGSIELKAITSVNWNPQGSWLCVASDSGLTFCEKNCRERQCLNFDEKVSRAVWSYDSDVLAVMAGDSIFVLSQKNRIFRRKLRLERNGGFDLFWSSTGYILAVGQLNGNVTEYEMNKFVDSDENSVYVIDGKELLISDWGRSLIPPPMAHRKMNFKSQVRCLASDGSSLAVVTEESVHIFPSNSTVSLSKIVHGAVWRNGVLFLASKNEILTLDGDVSSFPGFISALLPSYAVWGLKALVRVDGCEKVLSEPMIRIIENGDEYSYLSRTGALFVGDSLISRSVSSFLFTEKLLTYISDGTTHHINYAGEKTSREIESSADLQFFCRRLFSIVIQMHRGNIETVAPHAFVTFFISDHIQKGEYGEALRISRRYQIPFSTFIALGQIDLDILTQQVSDTQLRQLISVLKPFSAPRDLEFTMDFLSFILSSKISFADKELCVPFFDYA